MQSLLVNLTPLTPEHTINDVGEMLLLDNYKRFLSLPVVEAGKPIGCVSRDIMQSIYLKVFGREVHSRKPVTAIMNANPLVVEYKQPMERVSEYITSHVRFPITEDFIITNEGEYAGVGHVVDLLRITQQQLDHRNRDLATAYKRLQSSQTQLVQSEKMASLGQMVAGVAHEINTPLGYVKNNVTLARELFGQLHLQLKSYESLLDRLTSGEADEAELEASLMAINSLRESLSTGFAPEDVDNLFDDTLYGVDQISEIVLNLRDFSRLDQAPVDNVNLNQCMDSALLIARTVLKHKADIVKEYGDIPRVSCSPSQVNQVFLNLLTNAAQAIETHGRILVKSYHDEKYAHFIVQDNGKGIAKENLKKIFDPFFTTKPVGQGTGLGLSISYQIVRRHGGHIRVASQPGVGAKFCVSLPLKRAVN